MKNYIETNLESNYYKNPIKILEHLFAVLGNGIELSNKGYLGSRYKTTESYDFGKPEAIEHIYPWTTTEEFQPFRKYAGCRNVGFKESAQYFIDCILCTPDNVNGIKKWKENIHIVKDALLSTPIIRDKYNINDISKFIENTNLTDYNCIINKNKPENSISKVWLLESMYTDCPKVVGKEINSLWSERCLGNDNYIAFVLLNQELFDKYPLIYFWLQYKGVPKNDKVLIHHWW